MSPSWGADQQVINRYTDQPIRLPAMLRAQIEAIWGGQQVVRGAFEAPMLSGNVLWILAGSGEAALAVLRFVTRNLLTAAPPES